MTDRHTAADEFEGLDLGDARRAARVLEIVRALESDPAASFPQALKTVAAREAFYRLINNDAVTIEALLQPHTAQVLARLLASDSRPLIAIDKTRFSFEGEGEREGLDRISNNKQGYEAFFALALSTDRQSHGVLGVQILDGKGNSSANDWNRFLDYVSGDAENAGVKPIFVMDREADMYELFASLRDANRDFVVRICSDRCVKEFEGAAREQVRAISARNATIFSRNVRISRRKRGGRTGGVLKAFPPRVSREATLSVRACSIALPNSGTKNLKHLPSSLPLNLVQVIELEPPKNEAPIEWLLFSSLPIDDQSCVEKIVDAYRGRWVIEEYFRALKTGCQYEARQLESLHALTNALALLIPVAWRLLELRTMGEEDPRALASELLDPDEITVLRKLSHDVKLGPRPLASEALLAVASLGGHIRQNGRPGWQVLYRGFKELLARAEGYKLAKAEM
jgi:hypothetical protein